MTISRMPADGGRGASQGKSLGTSQDENQGAIASPQ